MKKLDCSVTRLASGFAVLFLIFSISNSCTKTEFDDSGPGIEYPGPSGNGVTISGGFNPVEIKISAGNMVIWTNDGPAIESVTSDDGLFDGIIRTNETYSFKFLSPGIFTYHSRMHPNMIGKVIVN